MSRGKGVGYIPGKSNLKETVADMLNFFTDGDKSFSQFLIFAGTNYNIRENSTRMTLSTLCRWKLLQEIDYKLYAITEVGKNYLTSHSSILLGKKIHLSTIFFGEILQELEDTPKKGSDLKQIGRACYNGSFFITSNSDLSCRLQYLIGLGFVEKTYNHYKITPQGVQFLDVLREQKLLSNRGSLPPQQSKQQTEINEYLLSSLDPDLVAKFENKCARQKIPSAFVLERLMEYYLENELKICIVKK